MAKIGKNVLENLTEGMYEDSTIIFREYIQNSTDSIDNAIKQGLGNKEDFDIFVDIDSDAKKIVIEDNGAGILSSDFRTIMSSIADSYKDRNNSRGFRGIGRLGGLAFCDELVFTTKSQNEAIVSECIWNCKQLLSILNDPDNKINANDLVEEVTEFRTLPDNNENQKHYFKVEMKGVSRSELLDVDKINNYLSQVAPIKYSSRFEYRKKIEKFVEDNNLRLDDYKIYLNGDILEKPYNKRFYESAKNGTGPSYDEIRDVEFKTFYDNNNELIAWAWFGIQSFNKSIPVNEKNLMRGIRIRKGNIQIGDPRTITRLGLSKEDRANGYFVGEIHAVGKDLIPNARRDYFNLTSATEIFEERISGWFKNELHRYYHVASEYKNALKNIKKAESVIKKYDNNMAEGAFINKADIEKAAKAAQDAQKTIDDNAERIKKIRVKTSSQPTEKKILDSIDSDFEELESKTKNSKDNNIKSKTEKQSKDKPSFLTDTLATYSKQERKLIGKIYGIIQKVLLDEKLLSNDQTEDLIKKINEELKLKSKKS